MKHIILGLALPGHLNVQDQRQEALDRTAREAGFTDAAHMSASFRQSHDRMAQDTGFADGAALNAHLESRNR